MMKKSTSSSKQKKDSSWLPLTKTDLTSGTNGSSTALTRSGQVSLRMANDTSVKSTQSRSVKIRVDNDQILDRPWVMYVPGLTKNLLSLRRQLQDGFAIAKWTADSAILIKNTLALRFIKACTFFPQSMPKLVQWHLRLAHLNFGAIKQAAKDGVVDGLSLSKSDLVGSYSCDACEIAKARWMSYKNTHPYSAQVPLERVHIEKGGCITPPTFGGMVNYELYVDEASRFKWLFLLKSKSETLDNFKKFHVYAERQFGRKIKTIMTDNAQEYLAKALTAYCSSVGIEQLYTNVYSPEENCIAEQPNNVLMNKVRCLLQDTGLDYQYWGEALNYVVYAENRSPTKALGGRTQHSKPFMVGGPTSNT
ncbi:hypothetical protein Ae201684P_005948 [Aphanomyces euteiches]|nr:hypothetical protein Ae201684P_005948 [Aphanomyces euteiches]